MGIFQKMGWELCFGQKIFKILIRLYLICFVCICCKVEFIQSFCWLYFVLNLLVIQYLETLYLGGNHVRVVCEKVWRNAQECALKKGLVTGSHDWQVTKGGTRVKHAGELKSHASCTVGQNFQSGQIVSSRLVLVARPSQQNTPFVRNLTLHTPYIPYYKYLYTHECR